MGGRGIELEQRTVKLIAPLLRFYDEVSQPKLKPLKKEPLTL